MTFAPPPPQQPKNCLVCGTAATCRRCVVPGRARENVEAKSGPRVRLRRFDPRSLVGQVLATKYVVTDVIGEGGMGCVLEAHNIGTGQPVAVKVLTTAAFTPLNLKRFRRECKATAALRHTNLCEVFEHGTLARGAPYVAMERLYGETLNARLRECGPLELGDVVSISLQILGALSAAHQVGVIHRDVKPGNIFLTSSRGRLPTAKLIDFGLAKVLPTCTLRDVRDDTITLTNVDIIPGTPHYLSPEQIQADVSVDERVDVWAVGVTIHEMLSGMKVFRGESHEASMARIIFDDVPPIHGLRTDVPIELSRVIHRALAKDRSLRFRSACELRRALLEAWSRHRTNGVLRGEQLANGNRLPRPQTRPTVPAIRDTSPTTRFLRPGGQEELPAFALED